MKKKLIKKCVLSTILTICLILLVSTILLINEQPFTLNVSSKVKNTKEEKKYVYPVGLPVGLYLETKGVLVVDSGAITNINGEKVNPLKDKVFAGDYLIKFNEEIIDSKDELMSLIDENESKEVSLLINRSGDSVIIKTTPIKTNNGDYMLGVWVRDDTQGIGTLTCVTTTDNFVGLGHGICDIDTLSILNMNKGKIYNANIWGIKKGKQGEPGGLCGSIEYKDKNIIGTISSNTTMGINGKLSADLVDKYNLELMEVASVEEIKEGPAYIQIILDGEIKQYKVNVSNINKNNDEKCMLIKVTDEELLDKTSGIVQGMSGSPIIQDGKLIGAVTHVLVNDPSKGYGIFIEKMLYY